MKSCLIVFAKEPRKGKVKTRLRSYLSEARCLNLYKAFLRDTISIVKQVECAEKFLAYESGNRLPRYLMRIAPFFKFFKQKGRNLGQRMHSAFMYAARNRAAKIVVIGSDAPGLPAENINRAFSKLDNNDLVIGPSLDGGYYLIALKKPYAPLFKGIKWSSQSVLKDTLKNAKRLRMKIALLDSSCDVDNAESLGYLGLKLKKSKNRNIAQWTRRFLKI